jgi:hypothetical protein
MKLVAFSRWLLLCSLVLTASCNKPGADSTSQSRPPASTPAAAPIATPVPLTAAELQKLKWIEGSWRGTGDIEKPFYERYRFENDSTLLIESFDDEKLEKVSEVSRYELRDGQFGNTGDVRWVATKFDDKSITFSPVAKARNSFTWQSESKDLWKATLTWPDSDKGPAKQRIYNMERMK